MTGTRKRVITACAAALLVLLPGAVNAAGSGSRQPAPEGEGFESLATIPLDWALDAETTEVRGRSIVLGAAVSFNGHPGGLLVANAEDPSAPRVRAHLECSSGSVTDIVRTWTPALFAVYVSPGEEPCLGLQSYGFALVDVSRPARPRVVSSTPQLQTAPNDFLGGRSIGTYARPTAIGHPTQPIVYSTRVVGEGGEILVWSLENEDGPELVSQIPTATKPHTIDLNETGTVLAVAEGATFTTYDLSDPAAPLAAFTQQCPGCSQTTFVRFLGSDTLVVYDESWNPLYCPTGALYFYALDLGAPRLTGVHHPSRIEEDSAAAPYPRGCVVADFDVSSDGKRLLLTWNDESVRLLEVTDTAGAGAAAAGVGPVTETGWFRRQGSRVWSARFGPDDTVLAVDMNVGIYVLRPE